MQQMVVTADVIETIRTRGLRPRLSERIKGALQLQPMSIRQLAACLSVTDRCIQAALAVLMRRSVVRRCGYRKHRRRCEALHELTNTGRAFKQPEPGTIH
jgi:hypothetical protein